MATADAGDPSALRAALASFAAGRAQLARAPSMVHGRRGASNDTWRVRSDAADWIVRIGRGADQALVLDRCREAELARRAAAAGFAPPVVHAAPERALFVTTYVEGGAPDRARARSAEFAGTLGRRLAELHALPWPLPAEPLDLNVLLGHYLKIDAPRQQVVERGLARRVAARFLAGYRPQRLAFCHLDLHRDNLLLGPPLRLIDWEYAAYADPWLDLAAFASYEDLEPAAVAALLAGYGAGAPASGILLAPLCALFDCLRVLWTDAADAWGTVPAAAADALRGRLEAADRLPAPATLPSGAA